MKGVYIMRYLANDGKVFDREEDCTAYEQSLEVKETARKLSPQEALNEIRREEIKRLEKRVIKAKLQYDEAHKKFHSELLRYVKDTDDNDFGVSIMDDLISKSYRKEQDTEDFLKMISEFLS